MAERTAAREPRRPALLLPRPSRHAPGHRRTGTPHPRRPRRWGINFPPSPLRGYGGQARFPPLRGYGGQARFPPLPGEGGSGPFPPQCGYGGQAQFPPQCGYGGQARFPPLRGEGGSGPFPRPLHVDARCRPPARKGCGCRQPVRIRRAAGGCTRAGPARPGLALEQRGRTVPPAPEGSAASGEHPHVAGLARSPERAAANRRVSALRRLRRSARRIHRRPAGARSPRRGPPARTRESTRHPC